MTSCIVRFFFTVSLFLFAFSGLIKWMFPPLDLTLVFLALCLLAVPVYFNTKAIWVKNPLINAVLIVLILHLIILSSIFYTKSESYYIIKIVKITSNLFALFLPILILNNSKYFAVFRTCCKYALLIAILILLFNLIDNNLAKILYRDAEESLIPDYMSISYFLGTMILYLIIVKSGGEVALLMTAFIFMLLLAAKGPILFLFITLIAFYKKAISRFFKQRLKTSLLLIIGIIVTVFFLGDSIFHNLSKRLTFFSGGLEADKSSLERVLLLKKSADIIQDNFFFGIGIGGFSKEITGIDARLSPHNIFVELWVETGLLSLLVFFILLIYLGYKYNFLLKQYYSIVGKSIISICFYMFLSALVASYLEDLRLTYFWLGVSIAYYSLLKNQNSYVRN